MTRLLVVASQVTFPQGYAATRFVRLLCGGLATSGLPVHILAAAPGQSRDPVTPDAEVTYEYVGSGQRRSRLGGAVSNLFSTLRLAASHAPNATSVIYYGDSFLHFIGLWLVCRLNGKGLIPFLVEWPPGDSQHPDWVSENAIPAYVPILQGGLVQRLNALFFYRYAGRLSDGVLVISGFLERILTQPGRQSHILKIPILVSPDDVPETAEPSGDPYWVYCAHLDGYIHDALYVVRALSQLQNQQSRLVFVGGASTETSARLLGEARRHGVGDRIDIRRDYLSDRDLADLYARSTGLLSPVYDDPRSLARFPSKIADYLLSGRPVVSAQFGEVGQYLTDGVSAYLAASTLVSDFAAKMAEVLDSPARAAAIGASGRKLAIREFDAAVHGSRLKSFIEQLGGAVH